jgi:hypothetical protein
LDDKRLTRICYVKIRRGEVFRMIDQLIAEYEQKIRHIKSFYSRYQRIIPGDLKMIKVYNTFIKQLKSLKDEKKT